MSSAGSLSVDIPLMHFSSQFGFLILRAAFPNATSTMSPYASRAAIIQILRWWEIADQNGLEDR